MNIKVLENKKEKIRLEVEGEDATFLNILQEKAWEAGATQAVFSKPHPYISESEIIVQSANPKKTLVDAAQFIANQAKEFGTLFKRAAK